jgi:predicted tellurium resistance membrane protein TerC
MSTTTKKKSFFSRISLILFASVTALYLLLWLLGAPDIDEALQSGLSILFKVLPVLLVVILFMTGANLVPNSFIKRHAGIGSGAKGYLLTAMIFQALPQSRTVHSRQGPKSRPSSDFHNRSATTPQSSW